MNRKIRLCFFMLVCFLSFNFYGSSGSSKYIDSMPIYFDFMPPSASIPYVEDISDYERYDSGGILARYIHKAVFPRVGLVDFNTFIKTPIINAYNEWKNAHIGDFETKEEFSKRQSDLENTYYRIVNKFKYEKYYVFVKINLNFDKDALQFISRSPILIDCYPLVRPMMSGLNYCINDKLVPQLVHKPRLYAENNNNHYLDFCYYYYKGDNLLDCREFHEKNEPYLVFVYEYKIIEDCKGKTKNNNIRLYNVLIGFALLNFNTRRVLAYWDLN